MSQLNSSGPPAPASVEVDFTGTKIQKNWPFARGLNPKFFPIPATDGPVGQWRPECPRKLQVSFVSSSRLSGFARGVP